MMRAAFIFFLSAVSIFGAIPAQWQSRGVGGGGALFSPSWSPHRPGEMFVACDMSELFHTTNFSQPWRMVDFREIQGNRSCHVQFTSDPLVLYALDNTSIDGGDTRVPSKSLDGGFTWTPLAADPTGQEAYFLAADVDNTNRLIVSAYTNIYFSANGGASFTRVFSFDSNGGNGCFIAGAFFDGSNIYVGCTAGLVVSTNNGATFALSSEGGIPGTEEIASFAGARQNGITRLFCLTVADGTLYPGILIEDAYFNSYKVYSLDRGQANWVVRTNGIASTHMPIFVGMARNNISTAYLAGQDTAEYPVIYKTSNAGTNWQTVLFPNNNQNVLTGWEGYQGDRDYTYDANYVGFAVAPNDANRVALTGYGFLHYTTNGGALWQQGYTDAADQHPTGAATPKNKDYHSVGLENTTCWSLNWADSNHVFACFSDIRGIRSTNAGAAWSFNYSGNSYNSTYQIVKRPSGTLLAAVASVHDMYQSTRLTDALLDPGSGEVMYSTDTGATWQRLHNFTNVTFSLALDPNNTNRLYAAVVHSTKGGFYVSSNIQNGLGATWSKLAAPPRTEGHPFQLHVLNDGALVCTYSGRRNGAGNFTASSGVYVSTDGGTSWADRSHTNMYYWTKDIVLDPFDPGQSNWYVGVFSGWGGAPNGKGGLYRTTNRGLSWTRLIQSDRVTSCTINPASSNELYFSTETEGLWYSANIRSATPSFIQVGNYPFRQPERVFFNPYNAKEIWVTSFGHGLRVGSLAMNPPQFTSLSYGAGGWTLGWANETGQTYRVEKSLGDLAAFQPITSNLTVNSFTDPAPNDGPVFYRLLSP